ncbi:UFD1-domain-containing protein [Clavulina sp. PMI_390]|nr:UFD1-domain-containing protein [Clavulina sp. PMI_390]
MAGGGGNWPTQPAGHPRSYDEYMKAYSVAMLPGKEREYLSYGGKSDSCYTANLNLDGPWTFQLRNPSNPAASTHAGVLEFIAREGVCHLPQWMMRTLRLNEGDPIRLTGARLPKGKLVKLQAQSTTFLEISDPKAVLEQALRNFSTLTQGDMIEIVYNSIVFELLIMEIKPEGSGISLLDTDLEVDFATPKGYVEPKRKPPPPPETMASKLKIDVNSSTPGSSRPGSSLGQNAPAAGEWESFKGAGQSLNGRKTKGKGKSVRKIEDADPDSKIYRTDKARMVTNDSLNAEKKVPAPLRLPLGKLFFGYPPVPYKGKEAATDGETPASAAGPSQQPQPPSFSGTGNTLSGRAPRSFAPTPSTVSSRPESAASSVPGASWGGGGQTLGGGGGGGASGSGQGGGRKPPSPEVIEIDSD